MKIKRQRKNRNEKKRKEMGSYNLVKQDFGFILCWVVSFFLLSFNTNSFGCSTLNNAINSALTAQHLLHLLLLQL